MKTKTSLYNPFDYLQTDEEINEYLADALLDEDPRIFLIALGHLAKKKGMTQVATETGLGRESLYKSLSREGNPGYAAVIKVARAIGVELVPRVVVHG